MRFARLLAAAVTIGACAHSDATPAGASAAATSARADSASGAVANGAALAKGAVPHDSISDHADTGRIMGDPSAKLWVIMASDFQCPYCKAWHDAQFAGLVNNYVKTGKVRLAFLNMPLSIHPNAVPAAEAAMCASVQNKFWAMHDSLFATQAKWEPMSDPRPKFDSLAASIGVNMPSFNDCVSKHLTLPLIQADHDRAHNAGVNSTPTFFVGGQTLAGADVNIGAAIDAALKGSKPGQ